jgi:hypothetical protein
MADHHKILFQKMDKLIEVCMTSLTVTVSLFEREIIEKGGKFDEFQRLHGPK